MPAHVYVSPDALISAAAQLDALARRLQSSLDAHAPALHLPPAGSEEVSTLAAAAFNSVADGFLPAAATGIAELVAAAATLRGHAAEYADLDHSFGAALDAGARAER
ncbi:PE family protein [Rhodococcus kronopolitis]|uniref:PE family protein n=1 Tax=Rhodococcus kronopolitis TaxID=1460226 RepID=A0ABV9FYV8_9NOCA